MTTLSEPGFDLVWREARTRNRWQERPVPPALLEEIYDLARMGPTSANCQPLRIVFVAGPEAKAKLAPALSAGNRDKTMAAPVTAIFAHDLEFYDRLPQLFPHNPEARSWFAGKPGVIRDTAFRNGTLQAAYFILAARAKGLDCGPMSGFDAAKVNAAFFPDGRVVANFLCNLGWGAEEQLRPRGPRLAFADACRVE